MNTLKTTKGNLLKRKIPIVYTLVLIVLSFFGLAWQGNIIEDQRSKTSELPSSVIPECNSSMYLIRTNGASLTNPLLMSDISEESRSLQPLKSEIQQLIQSKIEMGSITSASVYIRKMNDGEWISYNESESYNPGSLIKVPMMISYLKNAEKNPGLLSKELMLDHEIQGMPLQTFNGKSIETGKKYSIKELLGALISESDNKATFLLNNNADIDMFKRVFTDLGLPEPNVQDQNFSMKAKDYSRFMRVLYNATYLNKPNSEFAMTLLTNCSFKEGMSKGLPSDVIIGHKFGEMKINGIEQLHESGIVYTTKGPFLLTIMTKGKNVKALPEVIAEITKTTYSAMTKELTMN